jgi:predicted site-specific integrase-resolvase
MFDRLMANFHISYQTAWKHFKAGKIPYPTRKLPSGTIIVDYYQKSTEALKGNAAIYNYVRDKVSWSDLRYRNFDKSALSRQLQLRVKIHP